MLVATALDEVFLITTDRTFFDGFCFDLDELFLVMNCMPLPPGAGMRPIALSLARPEYL